MAGQFNIESVKEELGVSLLVIILIFLILFLIHFRHGECAIDFIFDFFLQIDLLLEQLSNVSKLKFELNYIALCTLLGFELLVDMSLSIVKLLVAPFNVFLLRVYFIEQFVRLNLQCEILFLEVGYLLFQLEDPEFAVFE